MTLSKQNAKGEQERKLIFVIRFTMMMIETLFA